MIIFVIGDTSTFSHYYGNVFFLLAKIMYNTNFASVHHSLPNLVFLLTEIEVVNLVETDQIDGTLCTLSR